MLKRIAVLVVIPLALVAVGFGGRMVMERSWDDLVNYQSPYTAALPVGQGGEPVTDQVVFVLQDGLRVDTSQELETPHGVRAQSLTATPMGRRCVTVNRAIHSAAALVVGVLMRGETIVETAQAAVNTSFFVALGLLLQLDLFYWVYGLEWDWYLPNLKWGFKYYLDLLQLFPTGLAVLVAPFLAIAAKVATDRIPFGQGEVSKEGR